MRHIRSMAYLLKGILQKTDFKIYIDMDYLTDKDFDHSTLKHVDFSIVECVNGNQLQSQIMQPIINKLIHNMPVKIKHFRIDMLQYPFIVEQFYILSRTAYLLFFNGEFIDRIDGIISYNEFSKRINGHITTLIINNN